MHNSVITWECERCRSKGSMANLDDATYADIRDAVERGHERRDADCHPVHGIRHVVITRDGKRFRLASRPRDDGPETVAGREVSRR